METVDHCLAEARIEASDPLVQNIECSELLDGLLTLQFRRGAPRRVPQTG